MSSEFTIYTYCRFCLNSHIVKVIDLGNMPLAGGFLMKKSYFSKEKLYPLQLYFCPSCYLLQTNIVINKEILFKNYFYFSSKIKTLVTHFQQTARELAVKFEDKKNRKLLEIGCNDGSFLVSAKNNGFSVIGVDPAINVVKEISQKDIPIINDYFTHRVAQHIVKQCGYVDVVFSSNTLAHIEDMRDVLKGINTVLVKDGILVFDVHYVGDLIEKMQYDMIYHEHQYYYSLHALKKFFESHDLEIFDVKLLPIHAGSLRCYIQKNEGKRKITPRVKSLLLQEEKKGLIKVETFFNFNNKIEIERRELLQLLKKLKQQSRKIVGYGASGRGTILMNYCGLKNTYIDYVIDDAPVKQGAFMPGVHTPIVSSDYLYTDRPDYVLLFAWSFSKEIKRRHKKFMHNGGKFIVPLPKVTIL